MTLSWLSIGISLVHHVGWTLVHFVWQATFIALLASFLRRCLYRASARVRYLTLCVMLVAMAASPVVTFSRLPPITAAMTQSERMMTVAPQASSRSEVDDPLNVPEVDFDVKPVGDAAIGFDPLLDPRVQSPKVGSNTIAKKASWSEECRQILEPFLPWLVAGWITGVLFLSLRLLIGWRLIQRLRRQAIRSVGGGWQERLKVLADRLCVRLPVTLFESELVEVPTVIGWLQPTILLPVSFMTGLTIEQVESVLAHELAHVRRHDYLVNLIQTSVEVLLFYHPAVWWLSKNIREERELCCDDIAVTVCGSRMVYATALATIEEFRSSNSRHSSELAMASDGGSLLYRIRRLALPKPNEAEWFPWFSVSLTLVAVFVAIGLTVFASSPQLRNMDSKISPQLPAEQNDVTAAGSAEANAQAAQETGIHNDALLMRIDSVIEAGRRRTLTANRHSPWQIFQGLLAFQRDFQLSLEGRPVNALEWIANSQPTFDHEPWISKTQSGARFHQYTRPYAFQGHPGQFLSILAEADVPREFMFATSGGPVTLDDVIRDTQKEVNTREELTWVLWGLQHYLPLDARWTSQSHDEWSLEKLVEIEASAPVNGAPNGGNDRLIALTRARDKAIQSGRPLIGGWARADERIKRHLDLARQLQNADGSLSSRFYETESLATVSTQRMATTGLTLDFLAIALPDQRLSESWVERSVNSLLDEFDKAQHQQLPVDTLYRSLHALMSYRDRLSRKQLTDKSIAQAGDTSPAADPASMGLQLRITPLQGSTDDNSPELKNTTTTFAKSDELTFAIELKNVSDRPLTVLGVRYGESYANAAGKLNAEFFAPYLFKFEFLDAAGKPIPRASRTPERDMMILSGASAHELAPKASFVEVLRPGRFRAPLDYQLPPGDYRLRVKYQGPSKETVDSIKKHWPDHPQGNAWRGEVTSNEVAFSISRAPENVKPVDLVWGPVKEGLQAAIEFRRAPPRNGAMGSVGSPDHAPGIPVKSGIRVIFHVKNVSDRMITFASESGRQGDTIHVKDELEQNIDVRAPFFTGMPVMVRWNLKPREEAELSVLASGLEQIQHPGKYKVQYTIRFNSLQSTDAEGNVTFPLKGDWKSELETGAADLFLRDRTPEDDAREKPPVFIGRLQFVAPGGQPIESGVFSVRGELSGNETTEEAIKPGPIEIRETTLAPVRVTVRAPGFEEAHFTDVLLKPNQIRRLELLPAIATKFRVVTKKGEPIAGAKVRFFNQTSGMASSGPIPMHGLKGPVWATSGTDGIVVLDSLQIKDPAYPKLGDAVYFFCVEPPPLEDQKPAWPPRIIGPIKAGQTLGDIQLCPPLEVRGEIRGTPEELRQFSAEWDQPYAMKTDNPDATWDYAVSRRLETKLEGDKLTFLLRGLVPGRLRVISSFGPSRQSVKHTYSRRDPGPDDLVVTVDLTDSIDKLVITPKGQLVPTP